MSVTNSIGSIYGLPETTLEKFIPRLYPQEESGRCLGGYSSMTGFLNHGESLQNSVNNDRKALQERKISYRAITQKLKYLISKATQISKSTLVDQKFRVEIDEPTIGKQFCPFSPASNNNANKFAPIENACGSGDRDISITNTTNNKTIKFGSLLLHLIEEHHFFEGQVPYRLNPQDVIDVLELQAEENFSLPPPNSLTNPIVEEQPGLRFVSSYELTSKHKPKHTVKLLVKAYKINLIEISDSLKGLILPYCHANDTQGETEVSSKEFFLHVFNTGNKSASLEYQGFSMQVSANQRIVFSNLPDNLENKIKTQHPSLKSILKRVRDTLTPKMLK
jgi:hypothetical protein